MRVHYQYYKDYNLSISLNKAVNLNNLGRDRRHRTVKRRDRDENVHCGGMAGWNEKLRRDKELKNSILEPRILELI